eukprot:CAMPEP_0197893460 /NCGR_PEP_ID=MMETSP1439-20131203/32769_1 /TAXON_ID=66791 /ORGANISM="Gonyaulax spinifera, Strain CCMP409" /LENGTH=84 /DNA_ID=CAMNT_0043513727 /DNA_START=792 /DNA_END=1046 /DNA_ORIENTATION=+
MSWGSSLKKLWRSASLPPYETIVLEAPDRSVGHVDARPQPVRPAHVLTLDPLSRSGCFWLSNKRFRRIVLSHSVLSAPIEGGPE